MIGKIFKTNCYGDIEILEKKGNRVKVRFLNTGYVRDALFHNVRKGKVKDHTVEYVQPTYDLNERHQSNTTGWFTILQRKGKNCIVQFDETGYTKEANIDNARCGKVKDPYYKTTYGVGFLGEFDKQDYPYWKQAKQLWRNMMKRCYCEKDTSTYAERGVSVDPRWHCFANFLEDISDLENFDLWMKGHQSDNKYNLDKDLKVAGNKVYSKDLCMFVTEYENKSAGALSSLAMHGPIHLR